MRRSGGAFASDVVWSRLAWVAASGAIALACKSDAATAKAFAERRAAGAAATAQPLRAAPPRQLATSVVRLSADVQDAIDETVRGAIAVGELPGAVVTIGRRDGVAFRRAYGALAQSPARAVARPDAIYDLASLTKPIVTATAIGLFADAGRLSFDDPISRHLPEFRASEHAGTTLRQLLTHSAGLPAILPLAAFEHGTDAAVAAIARTRRRSTPGERVLYSDLGFVLLGEVAERVAGQSLSEIASERVFGPLGMSDTRFGPLADASLRARIAPTERSGDGWLQGTVHDPRAAALGGVAGHAGLFSCADDLARFARMMLGGGELDGTRVLSQRTVKELTRGATIGDDRRALGWDVANGAHPGNLSARAFGHGGFTGTSLWIDPELDLFVIVLSNRLHPDGKGAVEPTAGRVQALAAGAARRAEIAPPSDSPVLAGIDVLARDRFAPLAGLRVGLLTNAAARARDGRTSAELLASADEVRLVALLSPEHGLEAKLEGAVADDRDPRTGLPVRSLYGQTPRPRRDALDGLDAVVVDLPDVGARFYTYLSTMRQLMLAANERRLRFVVLDRPNPLGGDVVEGPSIDPDRRSFVNHHPLPIRHGLTAGELAQLLAAELELELEPTVVPVEGWRRDEQWPRTGLPWRRPSPSLPSYASALLYPGVALLETTNVSVGRGTDAPFQRVGAPWISEQRLLGALLALELPHVELSADRFVPQSSVHAGVVCRGVRIRVTDPERVRPVTLGLAIARELARLHRDEWSSERFDVLLAHRATFDAVLSGALPSELARGFEPGLAAFRARRARHLLY